MNMQRLMAVLAIALLGATPGCKKKDGNKEAPKTTEQTAPTPPTPEKPKPLEGEALAAHYQQCWDAWNQRKWDDFGNCYAEDAVSEQAGSPMPKAEGRDAIVARHKGYAEAMPDAKGGPQLTIVDGRTIAAITLVHGTQTAPLKGPMGEIPPTGKKMGGLSGHVVEFNDQNQIAKEWWFQDTGTMMGQLGLSKQPVRPAMEKGWDQTVTLVSKGDDAEKANVDVYSQVAEAFNKHDAKGIDALMADDLVWTEAAMPKDLNKKEAIAGTKDMWKGFPDAKTDVQHTYAAGDYVIATGMMSGTNKGDMPSMKLKKTGKSVSLPFFEAVQIKDGKVAHDWLFYDSAGMMQQLGMMPPPGGDKGAAPKK